MPLNRPSPRGSVLRILVWGVSIVLILAVAAAFLFDRFLRSTYEPSIGEFRKEVLANIDYFCEQQTELSKDAWFHEPRTEGDAGPLLNAWLSWEPQTELPKDSPLRTPSQLPRQNRDFKDWLTASVDVSTLDFEWMRKLHAYDRWDITQNTPTPLPARVSWEEAAIPHYMPLLLWSKFRLLHGLRTGQPVEAARDVRQLAWLAYRTDLLLGGAIASALLQLEHEAYASLPSPPQEWRPMSRAQIDRLRAVIMSSPSFSSMASPVEVGKQARGCGEPAVSRCAALTEAAFMMKLVEPLAKDSYQELYSAFSEDVSRSGCATALPREAWERGMTIEELQEAGKPSAESAELVELNNLPGVWARRHMAGILISIAAPNLKFLKDLRAKLEPGEAPPGSPQQAKP